MIELKNSDQISLMKIAGRINAEAHAIAREHIRPGVSTKEIDTLIRQHIERSGATPSFLGYGGFPASACISVNQEVIHGIPSETRILQDGDIVKIDIGTFYRGYHGDSATTIGVGNISDEAKMLIDVTEKSFYAGFAEVKIGNRMGDVSHAVQLYAESRGYGVVREFVGHGVGKKLHEDPEVPNFGTAGRGTRLVAGMTFALEPMINCGTAKVKVLDDKWTVITLDGRLSAHYEHTIALTSDGPILLTEVK